MLRHRLNSREERRRINPLTFSNWINTNEGIIRWIAPSDSAATNRQVYNRNVAGVEDSRLFPKASVIVNPSFTADTDWTKGDAAITISGGKATWSGAQAGDADLTATVAPLTSGDRYGRNIVLSGVSAGTLTPLFGTQAGAAMDASGTYPIDEQVANGTAFALRGDSDFVGSCELVEIPPHNPLNASMIGSQPAQRFSRGLPWANSYDGNNDFDNIYSTTLNSVFDGSVGTLIAFFQVGNAAVWTDGQFRRVVNIQVDGFNRVYISRTNIDNELQIVYEANDVLLVDNIGGLTTLEPLMAAVTWNKSVDNVTTYFNDAISASFSGLGVWSGALSSTGCKIGAVDGVSFWDGLIADVIYNPTRAMSAAEIAEYYRRWRAA